ncbi:MAG: glutaminyl-tRNA synthetase [Flaviaesturariibacter sp.]|nr:glutaminyl-tRNA synthetase [Flaviaesturariibacter sp.]
MKTILLASLLLFSVAHASAQGGTRADSVRILSRVVEASCGKCRFGLKGDDCELAVRFDGKTYLVEGTGIDQHGNAHAADGFCNAVRKARVSGTVVGKRFVVTSFELLPGKKTL